jgi:hypothetical protein
MKVWRNRVLAAFVLGLILVSSSGCGTLLHPERMDAKPSRELDTRVVILDCLWLFAGIIPGVVALAVDFTTGAAYFSEGEVELSAGDEVSVNIYGKAPADAEVALRLVNADGRDLTRPDRANVVAGEELEDSLSLSVPDGIYASGVRLVLAVDGREQVLWTVQPRSN